MAELIPHPASFRDPSGFIFQKEGKYYRQVNKTYSADYELLMNSGLYDMLVSKNWLIPHKEINEVVASQPGWYKTLEPEQIPFISYPYEWCYGQFRDAVLLTISVLKAAISKGMIIKDATPFNVQFVKSKPIFIDTLSFEIYDETKPWVAYRQFCNMFLFPLYLEYYLRTDIQKIICAYPDGIPVHITSKLLPLKSGLSLGVWLHVYLQNTVTRSATGRMETEKFSKRKLLQLINHLESTILNLNTRDGRSGWSDYYESSIMGKGYLGEKEKIFRELIKETSVKTALDLGANDGYFAKILASEGMQVIAVDSDSRSISKLYTEIKEREEENILPLVVDAANPSPSIGFRNRERPAFHERIQTQLVVALALIHHLVIGRNISLLALAEYFRDISNLLIIEWIPRSDEKVQQMLASRKDIFGDYTQENFEEHFKSFFSIKRTINIPPTGRILYLMEKR